MNRLYLDQAATSFPKPEAVYSALDHYHRAGGAAIGRGAHGSTLAVNAVVQRARERAARVLGVAQPRQIVWTHSGTEGLNLILHGLLQPGDHVVTSAIEHNSVLRPLNALQRRRGIEVSEIPVDGELTVSPDDVRRALRPGTRLVVLTHASNVTGTLQPVAEVTAIAHEFGALVLLDAAQTAGHVPLDVAGWGVDFVACPGHKGLLGPLGTGLVYIRPGLEDQVESLIQGGTGSLSEQREQPACLPDKFESGNLNAPGLIGLDAGLGFLLERSVAAQRVHEQRLTEQMLAGLAEIPRVTVYGPRPPERRVGVVSLNMAGYEPQELAAVLDSSFGIEARAGLHCAPGAHAALGTLDGGGTLRLSYGAFNSPYDIELALTALAQIAQSV